MLLPKNTFVALAGQNAWHIWTGEALPRVSGKYLPSQLRTQKAGPEPDATARRRRGLLVQAERIGEEIRLRRGRRCCCFWTPPNKKSNRPSADAARGASATEPASTAAATSIMRRRMR